MDSWARMRSVDMQTWPAWMGGGMGLGLVGVGE